MDSAQRRRRVRALKELYPKGTKIKVYGKEFEVHAVSVLHWNTLVCLDSGKQRVHIPVKSIGVP